MLAKVSQGLAWRKRLVCSLSQSWTSSSCSSLHHTCCGSQSNSHSVSGAPGQSNKPQPPSAVSAVLLCCPSPPCRPLCAHSLIGCVPLWGTRQGQPRSERESPTLAVFSVQLLSSLLIYHFFFFSVPFRLSVSVSVSDQPCRMLPDGLSCHDDSLGPSFLWLLPSCQNADHCPLLVCCSPSSAEWQWTSLFL